MIFMLGVTTFDGEEEDEPLEDILTGVVDPDTCDGDLDVDVLE